ncbi:hypothetical protein BB934_45135 (plasmid) [Microvirga ossetica]|uniref:Invasion associated locus B family protein n=1 Tax=Microvirga ossetica TaxID=1882682 RepID=A0A1B2EZL6_9HYPH|nr:hypothetical protein [Microvirga ossetica]ANY85406.1 hypothetical protein BB934_45135 [Microvirga ossetica]
MFNRIGIVLLAMAAVGAVALAANAQEPTQGAPKEASKDAPKPQPGIAPRVLTVATSAGWAMTCNARVDGARAQTLVGKDVVPSPFDRNTGSVSVFIVGNLADENDRIGFVTGRSRGPVDPIVGVETLCASPMIVVAQGSIDRADDKVVTATVAEVGLPSGAAASPPAGMRGAFPGAMPNAAARAEAQARARAGANAAARPTPGATQTQN